MTVESTSPPAPVAPRTARAPARARRVLAWLAWLTPGVLTTLLVSTVFPRWMPSIHALGQAHQQRDSVISAGRDRTLWATTRWEVEGVSASRNAEMTTSHDPAELREHFAQTRYDESGFLPGHPARPDIKFTWMRRVREQGAPFRCFYSTTVLGTEREDHGELILFPHAPGRQEWAVATIPLWPQLLANIIFYAVLCRLLLRGPGWLKKRRRLRRGLCPSCAYDVQGARACPECGWIAANT